MPLLHTVVREVAESAPALTLSDGNLMYELRPALSWGKGKAVTWLLTRLRLDKRDVCPVCVGDDAADEDMFAAAGERGVGVFVGTPERPTLAGHLLRDQAELASFLRAFVTGAGGA